MLPRDFTLLQVTPALDAGGVETLTMEMARAVASTGARSLVASRGGTLEDALATSGGELVRMPVHARNPASMAANAISLERLIQRERISLVHVRSRAPAFSALWASRRAGVPLVSAYHGIYSARSPMKRWYNSIMARGDAVIVNSAFTRDHVLAQHRPPAAKVQLIPEGVNLDAFDPAAVSAERVARTREAWRIDPGDRRSVILVAARLTGWKGHRLIISALAASGGRDTARLVFVGRGGESPYAAELAEQAARTGVVLTIAGPSDDMPAAFLAADLIAAPSTEAESFGRSVVEAGAMARVVLASALGGPAETIMDGVTGFLVQPGDQAAWSAALDLALVLSPTERAALGAAARERIRTHYSSQRMCEATFALYRRLTECRP
jgi:glycosyltransferase involved in cell wall biosynthesis